MKVIVESLTLGAFAEFGEFGSFLNPTTEFIGARPVEFFRDINNLRLGNNHEAAFSVCKVFNRSLVIETAEYHSFTAEALIFLDADCYFWVAPATPKGEEFPAGKVRVFDIPKGTGLFLKPGVWHHAPFVKTGDCAHVLVALPPRTYANDTFSINLRDEQVVTIDVKLCEC